MKQIGLHPSTTGEPGGKEAGQSVTHCIIPGGPYAKAYAKLKANGLQLHWQSAPEGKQAKAKKASKTKFTCPECGQNAWGKPDTLLICGVWLLIHLLILVSWVPSLAAQPSAIAIVRARIIDGRGGPVIPDGAVLIRGKRIEVLGATSSVAIPAGAQVIDAAGKTVMPGLADMHVHLVGGWDGETTDMLGFQRYLNALLYAGVTTVLDTGNVQPYILQMRQEVAAGRLQGPRIYCAGALIDGPDPIWPELSITVSSLSQIPALVQRQKSLGVDVLKGYMGLSGREVIQLAVEAKKVGLNVIVDQGPLNGSTDLMNAGIAGFAHLPTYRLTDDAIELARMKQILFITTIALAESFTLRRFEHMDFLSNPLIADTAPPWFLEDLRTFVSRPDPKRTDAYRAASMQRLQAMQANALKLWKAGVLVIAGTDAAYPGDFQGEGIHHELELLVESGLTPLEAISSATRNASRLVNASDWGTLEPGKVADLLVISGRPDQNIQQTHNVEMVFKEGVLVDRAQLKFNPARDPGYRTASPVSAIP
jgi:imidazolonepropionase-like amidohydrolase